MENKYKYLKTCETLLNSIVEHITEPEQSSDCQGLGEIGRCWSKNTSSARR